LTPFAAIAVTRHVTVICSAGLAGDPRIGYGDKKVTHGPWA